MIDLIWTSTPILLETVKKQTKKKQVCGFECADILDMDLVGGGLQ